MNRRDSDEGVPGVLFGRFEKDAYGHRQEGNPWVPGPFSVGVSSISTLFLSIFHHFPSSERLRRAENSGVFFRF